MTTDAIARHETTDALTTVRTLWGELLITIESPLPAADTWPPRETRGFLNTGPNDPLTVTDRAPLVLREHPAPLNLTALDTGQAIEHHLFALADLLAATTQTHVDYDDPRRWNYRSATDPGSRTHGLHWAAVWIDGRVRDEDTTQETSTDGTTLAAPFAPVPADLLHEAHRTARTCAARLLRTLGRDERSRRIPDRPCPWCGGELTIHTGPDRPSAVTCSTGSPCHAPAPLDSYGRRAWTRGDLVDLHAALSHVPTVGERAA